MTPSPCNNKNSFRASVFKQVQMEKSDYLSKKNMLSVMSEPVSPTKIEKNKDNNERLHYFYGPTSKSRTGSNFSLNGLGYDPKQTEENRKQRLAAKRAHLFGKKFK
jgi:hypothetical protein